MTTRNVDVNVEIAGDGRVSRATASSRIEAPISKVWRLIEDVEHYPGRVPMIHKVKLNGTHATLQLRFKISLFSVGFEFVVDVKKEHERSVALAWVSGEPKGLLLRYDLEPSEDGKATLVKSTGEFDVQGLGWLAKYFLRHHPEIELGIVPGVAIGLIESMRSIAES